MPFWAGRCHGSTSRDSAFIIEDAPKPQEGLFAHCVHSLPEAYAGFAAACFVVFPVAA